MQKMMEKYREMPMGKKVCWCVFLGMLCLAVVGAAVGFLILWIWNDVAAGLFGVRTINFWEALGLFVLGRLLFGSWKYGMGGKNKSGGSTDEGKEKQRVTAEEEKIADNFARAATRKKKQTE